MTRIEKAIQDVVDAWMIEGPAPAIHQKAKDALRQNWPTLYHAVKVLVMEKTHLTHEQQNIVIREHHGPYNFELFKIYSVGDEVRFKFIAVGPPVPNGVHKGCTQFIKEMTLPKSIAAGYGPGLRQTVEAMENIGWAEIEIQMLHSYGPAMFGYLLKEDKPYYETIGKDNS